MDEPRFTVLLITASINAAVIHLWTSAVTLALLAAVLHFGAGWWRWRRREGSEEES